MKKMKAEKLMCININWKENVNDNDNILMKMTINEKAINEAIKIY
jgi:hypothetical protein